MLSFSECRRIPYTRYFVDQWCDSVVCVCVCILLHVNVTQPHVLDYITLMYLVSWFVNFGPSQNALFIKFQTFQNRRLPCFCPVVRLRISFLSQNDNYACQSTPEQHLSRYLSVPLCCCSPYFWVCRTNLKQIWKQFATTASPGYSCSFNLFISISFSWIKLWFPVILQHSLPHLHIAIPCTPISWISGR